MRNTNVKDQENQLGDSIELIKDENQKIVKISLLELDRNLKLSSRALEHINFLYHFDIDSLKSIEELISDIYESPIIPENYRDAFIALQHIKLMLLEFNQTKQIA